MSSAGKSIDLCQAVNSVFSHTTLERLSGHFGLSVEFLQRVVTCAAPVLVMSLMTRSASEDGAAVIFSTLMSPDANARIEEQVLEQVATTEGLKNLGSAGYGLAARAIDCSVTKLSDYVAAKAGIPTQAAYGFTGLVAAALFGVFKHQVLLDQGTVEQIPVSLGEQWVAVRPQLTDDLAIVLGFESACAFENSVPAQLGVLSARLNQRDTVDGLKFGGSVTSKPADAISLRRVASSLRKWVWALFAILAVVIACVFAYAYVHQKQVDSAVMDPAKSALTGETIPGVSANASVVAAPAAASSVTAPPEPAASSAASSAPVVPASQTAASEPADASVVTPAESATSVVPASGASFEKIVKDAQLELGVNHAGAPTWSAIVGSAAEKAQLVDALTRKFGVGGFNSDITVDAGTEPARWMSHIDDLLALMSLPHADATIKGLHIELGGSAAQSKTGWSERIKNLFGPTYTIEMFDVDQAVTQATARFQSVLAKQIAAGGSCIATDVANVINLQVVNFARDSGHVPSSAKPNLTDTARLLKTCAERGKAVKIEVAAYSDNVGNAQANLDLSIKRAEAVKAFLVNAGVEERLLSAQGYGEAYPVASNATSKGRFENRRIIFTATQATNKH